MVETAKKLTHRRSWAIRLFSRPVRLLLLFAVTGAIAFGLVIWECASLGPYTSWFNNRLLSEAESAQLVGASQELVEKVLGKADNVRQFWEVLGPDKLPAPGAKFVTTFEYFPYPFLPFSKFQVHCVDGSVRTLERFDD